MTQSTKQINIGIELLRLTSMFMIVMVHVTGNGGVMSMTSSYGRKGLLIWALRCFIKCSPLIFSLISGYVLSNKKFKLKRIWKIWSVAVFWNIILYFVFKQYGTITDEYLKNMFLPVYSNEYWYVSSYVGMLLFLPLMNGALDKLEEKDLRSFILIGYIAFCVIPQFVQMGTFHTEGGFSTIYLCYLYLIGGYLKKYQPFQTINSWLLITLACISALITAFCKTHGICDMETCIDTPFTLIEAVSVFVIFLRFDVKNKRIRKVIGFLSASSFGVYIIHCNPLVLNQLISNKFTWIAEEGIIAELFHLIMITSTIFAVALFLDVIRNNLFKLIEKGAGFIGQAIRG